MSEKILMQVRAGAAKAASELVDLCDKNQSPFAGKVFGMDPSRGGGSEAWVVVGLDSRAFEMVSLMLGEFYGTGATPAIDGDEVPS
jgi:hypothetical protein